MREQQPVEHHPGPTEMQRDVLLCIARRIELEHKQSIAKMVLADGGAGNLFIKRIAFAQRPAA